MVSNDENTTELKKCVHIAVGTGGAEVLISSNDSNDQVEKLLVEAERLIDKLYKAR